MNELKD